MANTNHVLSNELLEILLLRGCFSTEFRWVILNESILFYSRLNIQEGCRKRTLYTSEAKENGVLGRCKACKGGVCDLRNKGRKAFMKKS